MEPINFKYKIVDANGYETGFFASHGTLTDEELVLDKVVLPLNCIIQVLNRFNRLAIYYYSDQGQTSVTIAPRGGVDRKLKETIDRLCSYRWSEDRRTQLANEGHAAAFRTAKCRCCTAVVDLSGFSETPQFYCYYCDTIQPADHHLDEHLNNYRICDRCQYYSIPTSFTTVYVILNVYSWQNHYACRACMRRECWKMLLINLLPPFVGFFFAIAHTIRAYGAGMMQAAMPELVEANWHGQKGRAAKAAALYHQLLERTPVQAGARYNLALAHARVGEWEQCLDAATRALADCSNYGKAAGLVGQALTMLGRGDDANHFLTCWGQPWKEVASAQPDDRGQIQSGTPVPRSSEITAQPD